MPETIKVEGMRKLLRELGTLDKELPKEIKRIAKDAADLVAATGRDDAPRRTGRLAAAIKPAATLQGAEVRVRGLVYAMPIHFGWPRHNIAPNPFLYRAFDARQDEVIKRFEDGLEAIVDRNISAGTGE